MQSGSVTDTPQIFWLTYPLCSNHTVVHFAVQNYAPHPTLQGCLVLCGAELGRRGLKERGKYYGKI